MWFKDKEVTLIDRVRYDAYNIGPILMGKLLKIGIKSREELINLGSKKTFILLSENRLEPCLSTLFAFEGAVENIRWHYLSSNRKKELREFFEIIFI